MSPLHIHRFLAIGLLLSLLSFIPTVQAAGCVSGTATDGFDDLTSPAALPGTRCFYTQSFSGTGANGFVVDTQAVSEPNSYVENNGGTLIATLPYEPICTTAGDSSCNGAHTYSAAIRMSQLPDAGQTWQYRLSNACTTNTNSACLSVDELGVADYTYRGAGSGVQALNFATLAIDTWYLVEFTISVDVDTDAGGSDTNDEESSVIKITDLDTEVEQNAVVGGEQWSSGGNSDNIQLGTTDASTTADVFIDDFHAPPETILTIGDIFCADPSLSAGEDGATDDFGYEYVEDWSYEADLGDDLGLGSGVELADGFKATESDGGSAYLAKGYTTGSQAFAVVFRIEAAVLEADNPAGAGSSSVFRVAFTLGNSGSPSGATKGDGTDGGNFDDHVGLRFEEEGNDWRITFRQNVAGAGYTTIGGSLVDGNPNSPTTYTFVADTRDLTLNLYSGNETSTDLIATRSMNAAFQDELWEDQWFVSTGTNGVLVATTVLDDNDDSDDTDHSTCIFDLVGGAECTATCGSVPNVPGPDEGEGGGGGGGFSSLFDPENIDSQLFIGFLLVAGMVFMGIRHGGGQAVIGSLFFVGLFLAYALGWMPLWVILVIFTISLAAIWVLPRQSKDGV